jgi:hypothetical protein
MEAFMRVVAIAIITAAIIITGLTLRPTPPATAAAPNQARVQIDPYALQSTVNAKSLFTRKSVIVLTYPSDPSIDWRRTILAVSFFVDNIFGR